MKEGKYMSINYQLFYNFLIANLVRVAHLVGSGPVIIKLLSCSTQFVYEPLMASFPFIIQNKMFTYENVIQ